MNDPISDMLTRIRNASRALLPVVEVPHSKLKESIADILKREGYVADFTVEGKLPRTMKVKLKYQGKKSIIEGLRRVSSPGRGGQCACGAGTGSSASGEFARKAANRSEQRLDSMHGTEFSPVFAGSRR